MTQVLPSIEKAHSVALRAFKQMQDLGVAPTPQNYAVWYSFYDGSNPALAREIQALTASSSLSVDDHSRLHETYLASAQERDLASVSARIESAMLTLMDHIGEVEQGAQTYGEALSTLNGELTAHKLNETAQNGCLSDLVSMVLKETTRMAVANQALEARLSKSSCEISRLREDLEVVRVEASTDPLTGLANRKAFETTLEQAAAQARQQTGFLSLIMLDIDFFKKFNDTHGHQTGDQVLKLVAKTMTANLPTGCTAARIGGEEFCILAPSLALQQAMKVAESVRCAVGSKVLRNRKTGSELGKITLSLGISEYVLGETLPALMERADEALYHAKKTGRNRVCTQLDLDQEDIALQGPA